jgi:cation:H+ antiporter
VPSVLVALLFLVSLVVTLAAARLFARRLDRLGVRFSFPEAVIGLLTAVAADGPEISSALFALIKGAHDVGVGVLVGSNGFNLAAMIGLSAMLTGRVRLPREVLALEGLVGLLVTVVAAVVLLGWLVPGAAAGLSVLILIPYLALVLAGARLLDPLTTRPRLTTARLARALHEHPSPERPPDTSTNPTHHLVALVVVDLALIVAGSAGMVQTALTLSGRWHISSAVLGVLILGPLTSIPNAATAVRLGLAGRAAALVGETFNSNTINLVAGVIAPSLFVTLTAISTLGKLQLAWLLAAMLLTLFLLGRPEGMRRNGAAALIVLYFAFAVGTLVGS